MGCECIFLRPCFRLCLARQGMCEMRIVRLLIPRLPSPRIGDCWVSGFAAGRYDGLPSPSYRPYPITTSLNQQAVTRGIAVGSSLTGTGYHRVARARSRVHGREPIAFFPPRHETRARGARSKDVGKHEGINPRAFNACHLALRQW